MFNFQQNLVSDIERYFSLQFLTQICLSGATLSTSIYQLNMVSPSENIFRFAYLLAFLFSITVQTFLYTYYGNGILETSNSLSNAVYFSKWYKMLPELGQTLVIFMERLKRKSEILAGSLFPLNLELFAKEMPLVGLGGYMLSRHGNQEPTPIAQPELCGEFSKLKISSSCDRISGKLFLNFSLHRCSYDGIKIRLNLHLKPVVTERVSAAGGEVDLFEHCPIETSLPGGIFRAQKRLNFILDIPKNQICPTSFISSQGSLTYRLVALITRDKHVTWTVISNKLLLDFKGYYNISGLELGPSVDFKQFFEEKITAIFTINKPVLLIGHDTNLNATLELEGVRDYSVDVTVTLQRRTKCAENVRADIILLQKQQADCREETTVFKWDFNVPNISRATYANELTPVYSVRYFAKYEATFKPLNDEDGIYVDGIGFIEVKVGTTSDTSSSSTVANRFDNLTLASRSESVASLMTLPPPYSQLSSRSGSVLSLETQPPGYDDLY